MGNFGRHHASKSKGKNKKKSLHHKEEHNTIVEEQQIEQMPEHHARGVNAGEEEKVKKMVVLHCMDDVELLVPKAEASRYGGTIKGKIRYDFYDVHYTSSCCHRGYSHISLSVESGILSKVIHYSNKKHHDPDWDAAEFVDGLDHATLFDLILAAKKLENQGLLGVACRAVADVIAGKSPHPIRTMFGIRPPPAAAGSTSQVVKTFTSDDQKAEERALKVLHIVRCQDFTAYDPKRQAYWHTRFCDHNIAFFDLDEESRFGRGPPLHRMRESSIVSSSVKIISLKVRESDVGFPINVYGNVIARDMIDYRCVYLFAREANDSQVITSPDDTLTLIDPHRVLVPQDVIYFEINLKIKCDGGATKVLSGGLTEFNICRLRDEQTMTADLTSWLSTVELEFSNVSRPLEASITINILDGPCELTRVSARTSGNTEARIILYGGEADAGTQMTKNVYSVALARRVVFVPLREKLMLHLVGDDEADDLVLTIGHCDEEVQHVCLMGCSKLQVKVSWTAIPYR